MADVKDKKDVSVLIESQLPEFVTSEHPKFKKFIEKYYEFMESHKIYFSGFTFDEFKLLPEDNVNFEYLTYEDGDRLQLESVRDTLNNANLQFMIGETVTGNVSGATAVITGTKSNTCAFIKSTNEAVFQYGENITGSVSRAYSTLANAILAGTFEPGAIESFRDRGPIAAVRELPDMQDIDKTNEGLVDDAWKKEFYTNVPKRSVTDRRKLLKRMKEVYRSKGNESSFQWLFRAIYGKEDLEFYYPKNDLMRMSDGRWTLDKTIKIKSDTANNLSEFTGKKITGSISYATAVVESQVTTAVGALQITEMYLSDVTMGINPNDGITGPFRVNESITSEVGESGLIATANTVGILTTVEVQVGGTEYSLGDEVTISGGGGQDAKARVATIADSVIEGIVIIDSGDGYSAGDVVKFIDEGTGGGGGAATIRDVIVTGNVVINSDQIQLYKDATIDQANYSLEMSLHNANTHLFANTKLIFSALIKPTTGKYFDDVAPWFNSQFIQAGDRLEKQVRINGSALTLTQSGKTVTLSAALTDAERRHVQGGKLTYANGNTNIITSYTNTTVFITRDAHSVNAPGVAWNIYYGANTHWGTIVGANSTQILYTLGSWSRDPDLDVFSSNNFSNDDNIIVYDNKRTKLWAAVSANSYDSTETHNGLTFDIGNTPANVDVTTTPTYTITDAFGQSGDTIEHVTIGALNTTTVNVGAINSFSITAGGSGYLSSPVVTVANSYIIKLGNNLDVMGANNSLLNLGLKSYSTGLISQTSNTVTLTGGVFPEANSGVYSITYANGLVDFVTAVVDATTVRTATERIIGQNDAPQSYVITYGATANTFTKKALIYNDDASARGRVLDFIDKAKLFRPTVLTGNTTLRVDMLTVQDFLSTQDYMLMDDGTTNTPNSSTIGSIALEDDPDGDPDIYGDSRLFAETTFADRLTAYDGAIDSTYSAGTITQTGTTVTVASGHIPNDLLRGTLTYLDETTSIITAYTNTTTFTVDTSKTIGSGETYAIAYNPALTKGAQRTATGLVGSGTGNRTVTVTDPGGNTELSATNGHHLLIGDKVQVSGSLDLAYNGVFSIDTVPDNDTFTYILPQDPTSGGAQAGIIKVRNVVSGYLDPANTYTVDISPKGNNATIEISAIAVGAIKSVEVYNFGAGYVTPPTVSTSTGNRNAVLAATIGAYAQYSGYYTGTRGLISSVPKVQDNKYYQDFSYVLKTDFDVNDYRGHVKRLVHPSGLIMFGEVAFRNKVSVAMFDAATDNVNSTEGNTAHTADTADVPRYRLTVPTTNSYFNVSYKSVTANSELEIYTADHPWHAMDGRVQVRDDLNLLMEDFRDVTSIARSNATHFILTDIEHNLEIGDVVQVNNVFDSNNGFLTHFWDGQYQINTVPSTDTYTFPFYQGDPGVGAAGTPILWMGMEDGDILLQEDGIPFGGGGYSGTSSTEGKILAQESNLKIKVEDKVWANTWRGKQSQNWENPFNGSVLDEDGFNVLIEPGGSFLYPKLQFPEGDTGTASIDMSFNSDILLEDYNEEGSGYILDETSGTMGNGPQRYISLESDTEGIEEGHITQSIPYMETTVNIDLIENLGYDLIMEDATVASDEIVGNKITYEDQYYEWRVGCETYTGEADQIIMEDDSFVLFEERTFWFGGSTDADHMTQERQGWNISPYHSVYQYIDKQSYLSRLSMEDGSLIANEDDELNAGYFFLEKSSSGSIHSQPEVQFDLVESMGYHLVMEDGVTHHIYEDETRALTEQDHMMRWFGEVEIIPATSNVQVQFISAPMYEPEAYAYVQIVRVGTTFNSDDTEKFYLRADLYSYPIQLEDEYGFIIAEPDTQDISGHSVDRLLLNKYEKQVSHTDRILELDRTSPNSDNPMKSWTQDTVDNQTISEYAGHTIGNMIWGMQVFRPRTGIEAINSITAAEDSQHTWFWDYVDTQDDIDKMIVTVVEDRLFAGSKEFQFGDTVTSSLANTAAPELSLRRGHTYRFDQSHISNEGNRLRFSLTSDGTHNSGTEHTIGVTISDDQNDMLFEDGDRIQYEDGSIMFAEGFGPGAEGAYTQIVTNIDTNFWGDKEYEYDTNQVTDTGLYYYSPTTAAMGNKLQQMQPIGNVPKQYWNVLPNYRYNTIQIEQEQKYFVKYGITEYTVTAAANKFYIDGTLQADLTLERGVTYRFDMSDASNTGHVLRLTTIEDGHHSQSTTKPFEGTYKTYKVTHKHVGGSHKYFIDGIQQASLTLERGVTYRFDLSDSSMSGHPFRFSETSDGTHNSGTEFTTGKSVIGTPGGSGAYVEYTLQSAAPNVLYYYCTAHSAMGSGITLNDGTNRMIVNGTVGSAGAYVQLKIDSSPDRLYYHCHSHANMGGSSIITVNDYLQIRHEIIPYQIPFPISNVEIEVELITNQPTVVAVRPNVANTAPRAGYSNYHRPVKRSGSIAFGHNGINGTGTGSVFQSELSVGDVIQIDDETFITEEDIEILMENDEKIAHEPILIDEVSSEVINQLGNLRITDFRWYIASEDSTHVSNPVGTNVISVYAPDPAAESFNLLGEDSNAGLEVGLEDSSGSIISEEAVTSTNLLLETGDKLLINDLGEFKVATISSDTALTVTRKHWGGTDAVPFWKQGTETSTTATVSFV